MWLYSQGFNHTGLLCPHSIKLSLSPICQLFTISRRLCLQILFSSQLKKNHFSVRPLCATQHKVTCLLRFECYLSLLTHCSTFFCTLPTLLYSVAVPQITYQIGVWHYVGGKKQEKEKLQIPKNIQSWLWVRHHIISFKPQTNPMRQVVLVPFLQVKIFDVILSLMGWPESQLDPRDANLSDAKASSRAPWLSSKFCKLSNI